MKLLFVFSTGILLTANLFGQVDEVKELVSQGIELHDQGNYNEAINKYKKALEIDKNSTSANYELSYTYMVTKQYDNAIKHSTIVLKQNSTNQHEAYIVLGSSLDLAGKPAKATKIYEKGLAKFPNSNLLNYNLALTAYNQKDYNKAEKAAINAIMAKPEHGSSHIVLSAVMQEKGQRIKSLLPLYYFLMLEPNTKRSLMNYNSLRNQLGQGVERKDEMNINVNVPISSSTSDDFGAAEMMVSLLAASRYTEENKDKSDIDFFIETNEGLFSILGELKKDNHGFWWDFYVTKFYDLIESNNYEAYSYYISQTTNSELVNKWIIDNSDKMEQLIEWISKK